MQYHHLKSVIFSWSKEDSSYLLIKFLMFFCPRRDLKILRQMVFYWLLSDCYKIIKGFWREDIKFLTFADAMMKEKTQALGSHWVKCSSLPPYITWFHFIYTLKKSKLLLFSSLKNKVFPLLIMCFNFGSDCICQKLSKKREIIKQVIFSLKNSAWMNQPSFFNVL